MGNFIQSIISILFIVAFKVEQISAQQQQWFDYSYAYYTTLAPPAIGPAFQVPAPVPSQAVAVEGTVAPDVIAETVPTTTSTTAKPTVEKAPFIPKLITYWGQNAAEKVIGTTESSLENLCTNRSPYSTIVIGYVNKFSDKQNIDKLPGMSFTIHCRKSYRDKYQSLLYCPEIASDIRYCHDKGIKILIGIGGPNSASYFESDLKAEKLAKDIWNLFLGGDEMPDLRPFGSVVLDGINMFMEPHTHDLHHDHTFLMTLHNLRRTDLARNYLITLSPSCLFPDPYFGPGPDKVLQDSISLIDQIYVRYTNPRCCVKGSLGFQRSLNSWRNFIAIRSMKRINAPDLFIGIPATIDSVVNGQCYRTPKELLPVLNLLEKSTKFRGFAVIDNAFDVKDGGTGFTFSKELLKIALPIQLHQLPKYKPILLTNESVSTGPVHDDLRVDDENDDDEDDDVTENDDDNYQYSTHSAGDKVLIKPTKPIIIISTTNEGSDSINMETNTNSGHENATVAHSEDDLMAIEAEKQTDDYTNHDQTTTEKIKDRLLSNKTPGSNQYEVVTQTITHRIKETGEEVAENENNENEDDSENVEEIVEDEREPPKNDPVLNNAATTGEFPHGIDINYPANKTDLQTEFEIVPINGQRKLHKQKIKRKSHKLHDRNDEFIIPFFDRDYPTIAPTAISNRKNWKDMKLKKMQKQKFHSHLGKNKIQPFFDRNLPTLKPTAKSGKHWKNQKTFHQQGVSNESLSEMDLWISIFPKNGSVEHLISKHISDKKYKKKMKKQMKRKNPKNPKNSKKVKSFCERCHKRDTGMCKCNYITYEDCKKCKNKLSKKCQNTCVKIEQLLHNIDKSLNSTLEREYLSNKFKNYSKLMLEKRIHDQEENIDKKYENNKKIDESKFIKVFSKLRQLMREDMDKSILRNLSKVKPKKLSQNDSKKFEDLKKLKFAHTHNLPLFSRPLHTGKLHTLKIDKAHDKLKFDHISNEIKTEIQVNKLGGEHKGRETRLNRLQFEKRPKQDFPISKEKHKKILRKLHLEGGIKSQAKIKFSNETKEIIKQAVNLLQRRKQKHVLVNEDGDDEGSGSNSNVTSAADVTSATDVASGDYKEYIKNSNLTSFNSVIPKMYDDLKNFIVEDMANKAKEDVENENMDEDFRFLYDDDNYDPYADVYDDNESGSGEPYEEDIVYFYPDGSLQNYASPKKYDSKTYWKEDFEHRVPNVADTMTGQRSPEYELKIPNVFNPFGNAEMPLQHGAQMDENSKYLKLLQDDIQKQINTFNQEIIDEQPVSPEDVKSNNTKPQRLPEEELEKFVNDRPDNIFENDESSNEIVEEETKKHNNIPGNNQLETKSMAQNIIPKSELKKLIEFSNENNEGFLQFKDLGTSTENVVGKDLISNVNVKGNMAQLKYLMSEMQKTIDTANDAIQEKQMQDLNEVDAEEAKRKNKDQNNTDNSDE